MPFVEVKMWEGRTLEQKERLIAAISKAFKEAIGVDPGHLSVVITDVAKHNWGRGGLPATKWK